MSDVKSKREQARKSLTHDAVVHLAQTNGVVTHVDYLQIKEAVASTLLDREFDDE